MSRYPTAKTFVETQNHQSGQEYPAYGVVTTVPAPLIVRLQRAVSTGELGGEAVVEYYVWLFGTHVRLIRTHYSIS